VSTPAGGIGSAASQPRVVSAPVSGSSSYDPYVSIVLPCFNEQDHVVAEVERICEAMDASGYDYELVAYDDASTDGTLARLLRQRTSLGAFLDPVADKLLAVAALAALVAHRRLPAWLLALALFRDAVVLTLLLLARQRGIPLAGASLSRMGKYATFFTAAAVLLALADEIWQPSGLSAYVLASALTAGECLAAAALQYLWRFARRVRRLASSR